MRQQLYMLAVMLIIGAGVVGLIESAADPPAGVPPSRDWTFQDCILVDIGAQDVQTGELVRSPVDLWLCKQPVHLPPPAEEKPS